MVNMSSDHNPEMFAGYVPVIHSGYINAIGRHPDSTIGIFNDEILNDFDYIRKDIRALRPEAAEQALIGLGRRAVILGSAALKEALGDRLIMPDDDISRSIALANPQSDITLEPIFLRWDRDNTAETSGINPDRVVKMNSDDPIARALSHEKSLSSNWWRHVGAVVIDGESNIRLSGHNSPTPSEYTSIFESDPRITSKKGESIERSIDIHAEASIVAEAAKYGIALNEMTICVSTFPCPTCAKLIGLSGIKSCYYVEGYAMLDGYQKLKDYGVEIVKLEVELEPDDPRILVPYPTKS